jgi:hypothetical protein
VRDGKLRHYRCDNGAEFVISPDAEKVALELSSKEQNYLFESAKQSNDKVLFAITLIFLNRMPCYSPHLHVVARAHDLLEFLFWNYLFH